MAFFRRLVPAGLCLSILAGCIVTEGGKAAMRSRGEIISFPWETLAPIETRVSFEGADPVLERRRMIAPDGRKYTEVLIVPGGSLVYELTFPNGDLPEAGEEILRRHRRDPQLAAAGIEIGAEGLRDMTLDSGALRYFAATGPRASCFVFFLYPEGVAEAERWQSVSGSACATAEAAPPKDFALAMVDLVSRVRFDYGQAARRQHLRHLLGDAGASAMAKDDSLGLHQAGIPDFVLPKRR